MNQILFHHSSPRFGQFATWVLLAIAIVLALLPWSTPVEGVRQTQSATVVSPLGPELIAARWFYEVVRWGLIVCAVGWMFRRTVPWSCWGTCITFTILCALRNENANHATPVFNMTNMLLVVHAMWFQFYYRAMNVANSEGRYWTSPLYPRWVFLASLFYIGLFHTLAGLTKLTVSGPDWGDGLSLQLWVHLFGWDASPFGNYPESNRTVAAILQTSVLVIETIAVLCVFHRWSRLFIGLALVGLYTAFLITFPSFAFQFNALLVGLFLLPFEKWINRNRNH